MNLHLFVWNGDDVLRDYTSGLVCALAGDEEAAWAALRVADPTAWWVLRGRPENREDPRKPYELGKEAIRPHRVSKPEAFVCWGGG